MGHLNCIQKSRTAFAEYVFNAEFIFVQKGAKKAEQMTTSLQAGFPQETIWKKKIKEKPCPILSCKLNTEFYFHLEQ